MSNIAMQNETFLSLLAELGISELNGLGFERLVEADSRYLRDLKINVQNALSPANLSKKEAALIALAVAVNERCNSLVLAFDAKAKSLEATPSELADTYSAASLLAVNNVLYRFRHYVDKEDYKNMPAGVKMTIMGNPSVGKEFFELLSLAVSAVNGCEACVKSHEQSVLNHGASEARVFDAIRCASIIKGFVSLVA